MTPKEFWVLVATIVIAFCAGFWLKSSALAWLSILALVIGWIRINTSDDAEVFVFAIIAIIVAWITFYFSTSQHWVGDLFGYSMKEFILR